MLKGENNTRKAWLVGGGIASLSAAVFMIRDGGMEGENIYIFEELKRIGGSLDGGGDPLRGYMIRGGRMFGYDEKQYQSLMNLLSEIPSTLNPKVSVKDEMLAFNEKVKTYARARLIDKKGKIADAHKMGFREEERLAMIRLMGTSEKILRRTTIDEFFPSHFFTTNFWYMWASMFGFQPWHSVIEFKRYLQTFMHELSHINTLSGLKRTPFNQYDSIILPVSNWLADKGVVFKTGARVTDLEFYRYGDTGIQYVRGIRYRKDNKDYQVEVGTEDVVMVTNGCMTESSDFGSMTTAPFMKGMTQGGAWELWEKLAKDNPEFGDPQVFDKDVEKTQGVSFTVTCHPGNEFLQRMEELTGNKAGTGGLVTCKDSNWLLSMEIPHQPHFIAQPKDVAVFWGYGLFPDKTGNYVKKKMTECDGRDILEELLNHLQMGGYVAHMLQTSNIIPCLMPFMTSPYMPRMVEDRPEILPKGYHNLAFAGQFTEMPEGVVFTVEYSVKSAMKAVYGILGLNTTNIPSYYRAGTDLEGVLRTLKTMHR